METTPPNIYLSEKILRLQKAMFYNCSGLHAKLPVSIIEPFSIEKDKVIWFNLDRLPVTDIDDDFFAGELFFYKKGESYNIIAEGVAEIKCFDSMCIKFTITKLHYSALVEAVQRPSLYNKLLPMLKVIPGIGFYYKSRLSLRRAFHLF